MSWYAIRTKPHQEKVAELHLRQFCADVLAPLVKEHKTVRGQGKWVTEPLFPGYLFARFDLQDTYRAVKFARGVSNIVEFGSRPAEVSESIIHAIRERLVEGLVTIQPASFHQGQVVRITDGPLAGLEAVFFREMKKQQRVCVLLNLLGQQTRMTMGIHQINLREAL